jgi:isoquinoline 1-oxidoreductase subunit alpha
LREPEAFRMYRMYPASNAGAGFAFTSSQDRIAQTEDPSVDANMMVLSVNGKTHEVDVEPETPLLWVLRDTIGLTGTKYGCGIAQCGACTVHIDGVATRSCQVPVGMIGDKQITTVEALAQGGKLHPVQQAWLDFDVPQCGYCQSGMMMAVVALLRDKPKPTNADIDAAITNICRCGSYQRVRAAIHAVAQADRRAAVSLPAGAEPWQRADVIR